MKARWAMNCECCKEHIAVGHHVRMFHGRPWKTEHLIEYQRKRRLTKGK